MMENGEEYIMKQGAGPFYSVSDGSGVKVSLSLSLSLGGRLRRKDKVASHNPGW